MNPVQIFFRFEWFRSGSSRLEEQVCRSVSLLQLVHADVPRSFHSAEEWRRCSVSFARRLSWHSARPARRESLRRLNGEPGGFAEPQVCGAVEAGCTGLLSPSVPVQVLLFQASSWQRADSDFLTALMDVHEHVLVNCSACLSYSPGCVSWNEIH